MYQKLLFIPFELNRSKHEKNDTNRAQVQKMIRHQQYSTTKIYIREVKRLLGEAEDAITQI